MSDNRSMSEDGLWPCAAGVQHTSQKMLDLQTLLHLQEFGLLIVGIVNTPCMRTFPDHAWRAYELLTSPLCQMLSCTAFPSQNRRLDMGKVVWLHGPL